MSSILLIHTVDFNKKLKRLALFLTSVLVDFELVFVY